MLDTLIYVKKFDFDPPFWIKPPFLSNLLLIHVSDKNTNSFQKTERKILENAKDMLL
jgi:hypothetical protein